MASHYTKSADREASGRVGDRQAFAAERKIFRFETLIAGRGINENRKSNSAYASFFSAERAVFAERLARCLLSPR